MWFHRIWRTHTSPRQSHATIRYVAEGISRVRADRIEPERRNMPFVDREAIVHDMRDAEDPPSLVREGFTLVRHQSCVTNFMDATQIEEIYLPEAERLVKQATGATRVFALPRPILRSLQHQLGDTDMIKDGVGTIAHLDLTANSVDACIAAALARANVAVAGPVRAQLFTVWRSLRPPPQDRPLALCDMRTVAIEDLVPGDAVGNPGGPELELEYYMLKANNSHRWCYYSGMAPDEALIFRQFDSMTQGVSGCPHVSFIDRKNTDALPRLSIEARVCAFYD